MEGHERLLHNYAKVREEIKEACASAGRSPDSVQLLAISKFHAPEDMAVIARAGQLDFGENYVQEAEEKKRILAASFPQLRWHMTGPVQRKKAGHVAGKYSLVHTLDSLALADAMEKRLATQNLTQQVLIEVNIGGEPQKAGVDAKELEQFAAGLLNSCPHLELQGLMCLPPVFDSGEEARPFFAALRELRDALASRLGLPLPELSMGMSGDFPWAIREGATIVRIGTEIFGPRPVKA